MDIVTLAFRRLETEVPTYYEATNEYINFSKPFPEECSPKQIRLHIPNNYFRK